MCVLCDFRISKSRTPILKIYPVFTPESLSNFGITSFCDTKEYNCATCICFLCAFRISKSRITILEISPDSTPDFGIASFCDIKECNCPKFMWFLRSFRISESRTTIFKISPVFTPKLHIRKAHKCNAVTFFYIAKIDVAKIRGWLRGEARTNF